MNLHPYLSLDEKRQLSSALLNNIKSRLPELEKLHEAYVSDEVCEEAVYRFYYGSFKVYNVQYQTQGIVKMLRALQPKGDRFCDAFEEILAAGAAGRRFEPEDNEAWSTCTRPMVEAYFHAFFFLETEIHCGKTLDESSDMLPKKWAALLCLYDLR